MPSLLIQDIKTLAGAYREPPAAARGEALGRLPCLHEAFLLVENGYIAAFGPMAQCPERADEIVSASGRLVLPGWCDSHTHLVFAGSREAEFVDRIQGRGYLEIARRGGGIHHSARRLREADPEELLASASRRLSEIIAQGTVAVEIKSGYGLSLEGELKMLRVIRRLKEISPIPVKATFLGAHALPEAFNNDREAFIRLLVEEWLPRVAGEGLADYIDVFCEKGFFSVEETGQILDAGLRHGLRGKIHANQFNALGGVAAAVSRGAVSVDHLEVIDEADIEALRRADTIAALLPSASFFLNAPYTPARRLIEAGAALALASDYNPGSSPSGRMPFVLTLACLKMAMTPEEAVNAATLNGAHAMEAQTELGSITPGKRAGFIITKPIPSLAYIPYAFGSDLIEAVYVDGARCSGIVL
jgi:imidazolonepropionase